MCTRGRNFVETHFEECLEAAAGLLRGTKGRNMGFGNLWRYFFKHRSPGLLANGGWAPRSALNNPFLEAFQYIARAAGKDLEPIALSQALAAQLSQYRSQAAAKIQSLAGRTSLEPAARQELEELSLVLQAALAQVDVLSRQAALAEVLQHRIADQEDVLQQLSTELEHVDAQRAQEYVTTLANITELEEALALAQEQVDASHKVEELLELKEQLQRQLDTATAQLKKSEADLAGIRRQGKTLDEESADESDIEAAADEGTAAGLPDLTKMVALLKEQEAAVAAGRQELEVMNKKIAATTEELATANKKLVEAEEKLKAQIHQTSEAAVAKLKAALQQQKTDLEAAAAAKLEEAEATFTKQLAEMQTLLADYQTQVIELSKQNNSLEEEALALEQRLGEAEDKVEAGEKKVSELSKQLASGADGSKELREKLKEKELHLKVVVVVVVVIKGGGGGGSRALEAAKALELSRAQQDLLLAEKASAKLQAERDDLGKKVIALRSSQLKAEQALADASKAEAKLQEASQQLASISAQLSTETARAQKLAAEVGGAKQAEQDALAKLAVARSALEAEQAAAKAQSKQLVEVQQQLSGMKDTLASVTQDKAALSTLTDQISERDGKIE
eukprot:gene4743-4993_t